MLLAVIPAVVLIFIFLSLKRCGYGNRESHLLTLGAAGLTVVAATESLSLFGLLGRWPVAFAWLVLGGLLLWLVYKLPPVEPSAEEAPSPESGLLWGIGAIIVGIVALLALNAAPSTWDAMTYHMARVVRWAVNGNLRFYATNEPQQLFQPPLAEYFMLHLYLLGDSDRLVNLVQVVGFSGAAIGASLVARELGARSLGQAFAALLVLTLPQGIMQASGAKNDCSLALWLVAMVFATLRFLRTESRLWLLASGTFLGLAVLTKGTSYIFAPGLLLAVVVIELASAKKNWKPLAVALVLVVLAINGAHYIRTFRQYGSPIGNGYADGGRTYLFRNENIGLKLVWGNIWRNLALHAGTPVATWNTSIQSSTEEVIRWMGEDPQNPDAIWLGSRFAIPDLILREGSASNPVQMLLALGTLGWIFFRRKRLDRNLVIYGGGVAAAMLLFCILLRWQPWHTRLHFSWFVAMAPLTAVWMERAKNRVWIGAGMALLLVWAGPAAIMNQARPLAFGGSVLGATWNTTLFADGPPFQANFELAAKKVRASPCKDVTVDTSQLTYLYPLYALLDPLHSGIRVREIGVNNDTKSLSDTEGRGCATVCLGCAAVAAQKEPVLGRQGWFSERLGDIMLYSSPVNGIVRQGCSVAFGPGWGVREGAGQDWWRWTSKGDKILISTSEAGKLRLTIPVGSVPRNNAVMLRWNGKPLPDEDVNGSKIIELDLDAVVGQNVLEVESRKPGEQLPPDTRSFAIQLRNVQIKGEKVGVCEIP